MRNVPPTAEDADLLCYCTNVTIGELRAACREHRWPPRGKECTGKLCTGCVGDLLYCLQRFGALPDGNLPPAAIPDGDN
jgi:hypothetical protein